jgi:c-di-GMP-binding flagellar brake protein YcgR
MAHENWQMDRRKFQRIPVNFDILYKVNDPPEVRMKVETEEKSASMMNISEGGLALVTDYEMAEQAELEIQFHLIFKNQQTPPISVLGKVRYCTELADRQKMYRVGIEFTKIEESDKKLIVDFVKSMSGSWFYRFMKR